MHIYIEFAYNQYTEHNFYNVYLATFTFAFYCCSFQRWPLLALCSCPASLLLCSPSPFAEGRERLRGGTEGRLLGGLLSIALPGVSTGGSPSDPRL